MHMNGNMLSKEESESVRNEILQRYDLDESSVQKLKESLWRGRGKLL